LKGEKIMIKKFPEDDNKFIEEYPDIELYVILALKNKINEIIDAEPVIKLEDGDVLVYHANKALGAKEAKAISKQMQNVIDKSGKKVFALVVDKDGELSMIKETDRDTLDLMLRRIKKE
jgi:hypothetical protein